MCLVESVEKQKQMSYAGMFAAKRRVGNEMAETRRELALLKDDVTEQYVSLLKDTQNCERTRVREREREKSCVNEEPEEYGIVCRPNTDI